MMIQRIHLPLRLFALLAMTLPLAACAQSAAPVTPAEQAAPRAAAPPPQLVSGLPDFTQLVEQVGPAVVNVEVTLAPRRNPHMGAHGDMDQMPEFFRRFFGPGFQMPNDDDDDDGDNTPDNSPRGHGAGSGFIISSDGYVLTNHHVVDGAQTVKVKLSDRREFDAKVVGSDAQYDVALLKINASGLPTARTGDSNTLKPGQWVVAIGSPFGMDHSVTAGIVSAIGRSMGGQSQRYVPFIQTDVAINPGNSGGPLLNTRGEVVGINSQIYSGSGGYMGISFSIPIDLAMSAVEQIKKTGKVSRGQLGVVVEPVTADVVKGFNLPDSRGALVNQMVEGSAAAKAGVQTGDVIRSVNGAEIDQSSDLPPLIGAMPPGSKVRLGVWRDGRERDVTVTLAELTEDAQRAGSASGGDDTARAETGANALLGLQVADLTDAQRKQLGLGAGEGVRLTGVTGRAAREAGLSQGMVVLQVGRVPVGSVAAFNRELGNYKKGDVVMLLVRLGSNNAFVAVRAGD